MLISLLLDLPIFFDVDFVLLIPRAYTLRFTNERLAPTALIAIFSLVFRLFLPVFVH